ncbi:hypothetical protein HanPI659440_Chr15g0603831 [Helianthus annuus]|nr:hypothetical protein HanPI659440_Chr15g0603831 [Helianthus annuus]
MDFNEHPAPSTLLLSSQSHLLIFNWAPRVFMGVSYRFFPYMNVEDALRDFLVCESVN